MINLLISLNEIKKPFEDMLTNKQNSINQLKKFNDDHENLITNSFIELKFDSSAVQ